MALLLLLVLLLSLVILLGSSVFCFWEADNTGKYGVGVFDRTNVYCLEYHVVFAFLWPQKFEKNPQIISVNISQEFLVIDKFFSCLPTAPPFTLLLLIVLLLLSRHLWEWASALPGCIFPPCGVAGVVRE